MKYPVLFSTLALGLFLGAVMLINTAPSSPATVPVPGRDGVQTANCFMKVPTDLTFAGETVPLEDIEVYERLDKEIHVNTYFHSSTIQKIKLANRWFPVIEPILLANGIPVDFKYLAVAESGLQNAVSPAGAVGFWQFLKTTGQEYKLTITSSIDERYHVEKSTLAACKYLKEAHAQFGSWTMAAASYNMGRSGLNRDMSNQGETSYYNLLLNSETHRYVFRILALKAIMENPATYGFCFDETDLYTPIGYRELRIDTSVTSLVEFAKAQGTSYKTLKYMNPWLRDNKLVLQAGQSVQIKLPA